MLLVHQTVLFTFGHQENVFFLCISFSNVIAWLLRVNIQHGADGAVKETEWHNARSLSLNHWWLESSSSACIINACKKVWNFVWLPKTAAPSPSAQPMVPFQPPISADCFLQRAISVCLLEVVFFSPLPHPSFPGGKGGVGWKGVLWKNTNDKRNVSLCHKWVCSSDAKASMPLQEPHCYPFW